MRFQPGYFFGSVRLQCSVPEISVSHMIADRLPEQVVSHTHQDAHFILVTGGAYVSCAYGSQAEDRPVLVYNPPGTTHRDHFRVWPRQFFRGFAGRRGLAARALAGTATPDMPVRLAATQQHAMLLRIAGSCAQTGAASRLSLEALCMGCCSAAWTARQKCTRGHGHRWLHQALELINDCFADDLAVADVADRVGVHPIHLARTFRRHFRCTPGEFLRFRRLEKAAEALASTARPLAEVALASGFADQSHSTKAFVRGFGLPPGEYRRLTAVRRPQSSAADVSNRQYAPGRLGQSAGNGQAKPATGPGVENVEGGLVVWSNVFGRRLADSCRPGAGCGRAVHGQSRRPWPVGAAPGRDGTVDTRRGFQAGQQRAGGAWRQAGVRTLLRRRRRRRPAQYPFRHQDGHRHAGRPGHRARPAAGCGRPGCWTTFRTSSRCESPDPRKAQITHWRISSP